jgi:hypothetical protein
MPTEPVARKWITVEEAADEKTADAVARQLRREGVPVRLVSADPSDPSRPLGDLTVEVPLDDFEHALEALERLDEEGL